MALLDKFLASAGGPAALQRLYEIADRSGHKTLLHWLVFGSAIGGEILDPQIPEPSSLALHELVAAVQLLEPSLNSLLQALLQGSPLFAPVAIQTLVTAAVDWSHPVQVLDRPRPTAEELEAAYFERYWSGDRTPEFLAIGERIKKAARIARITAARRRRDKNPGIPKEWLN